MGELMTQPEDLSSEEMDQEVPEEGQGRFYTCKYCGQKFPSINLLGTHSKTCPERKKALEGKTEEPIYKTEGDANAILEDILERHPDITQRIRDEIMDWARLKGFLQPMEVQQIIQSFRGVSSATAQIIAAKYAFALQKAQLEGKLVIPYPPVVQLQPSQPPTYLLGPSITPPTPQPAFQPSQQPLGHQIQISPPTQPTFPWLQPPQTFQPPSQAYPQYADVRSMIREELRYLEEKLKPKETEAYVEVERPVRLPDGKIILGPDDKPIVEKMKVPVSQAHLFMAKETSDINVLREELKELRSELRNRDIEALRSEIEELKRSRETPQPQVPPEELVDKAVKKVLEEKEKERKEEDRFARLERAIREAASAKAVEGYRTDSYRLFGQGLQELASVIKERKPVEVIVREGAPMLLGTAPPKEIEAGAEPESILERLKKRGWVTEQ